MRLSNEQAYKSKTSPESPSIERVAVPTVTTRHIISKTEYETLPAEKKAHIDAHPELYLVQ